MLFLIVFAATILPILLWIALIQWWDRKEPEPPLVLARLFGLGALSYLGIIVLRMVGEAVFVSTNIITPLSTLSDTSTVVAIFIGSLLIASSAELVKFAIGYWSTRKEKAFTQVVDGVVYLTTIAWGAALVDNIFRIYRTLSVNSLTPELIGTLSYQLLFTTLLVGVSSGYAGLALGMYVISRRDPQQRMRGIGILVFGVSVAITLHTLFRFLLILGEERLAGFVVLLGALYLFSRFAVQSYLKRVHVPKTLV